MGQKRYTGKPGTRYNWGGRGVVLCLLTSRLVFCRPLGCFSFGGPRQDSNGDDDDGEGSGGGGGGKVKLDESTRRTWSMKDRDEELKTEK